ncbi:cobalamin-binding protein [Ectothiorhodospira lacustris]|uniref:cobalamin-binding protein n=1 Tax=Ectothiorhodospira lacustris TaxID=2899127 RepID=UPI001EE95F02|nr:cobalamin-binding protein [Ectothiorhodospira lacustris]MCG5500456.1 cobalamin-binding protein [Ectothiorhodospira lacustris]
MRSKKHHVFIISCILWLNAWLTTGTAGPVAPTSVQVIDDRQQVVSLAAPAERIISLAPHITELLFAVGAGDRIVGTVSFSDYPEAAADIPRIGSYKQLDMESILALQPDLVVAWSSGNVQTQVERLARLGLPLYYNDPQDFEQLALALERLGTLAGRARQGQETAADFRQALQMLQDRYGSRPKVTVFYQIWDRPLMTLNDQHLISRAIEICGGHNLFGDLEAMVPRLDREVVLAADPEAILAGGMGEDSPHWIDEWRRWPALTATARDNLFFIPPSLLQRATPRILEGTRLVCEALETARSRRPEASE